MRTRTIIALFFFVCFFSSGAKATTLDLHGYQDETGAITTLFMGDVVDPYFATKTLVLAHRYGFDIRKQATLWVNWVLTHQEQDFLFKQFCKKPEGWIPCYPTDADDILYAMWVELLLTLSPHKGMPLVWRQSIKQTSKNLEGLYDHTRGIYLIRKELDVGLFMDNFEIYASLLHIAKHQKRLGLKSDYWFTKKRAEKLHRNIDSQFLDRSGEHYNVSTQTITARDFYPHKVAQLYPVLYDEKKHPEGQKIFSAWYAAHGATWLALKDEYYPWGLVAMAAAKTGDFGAVVCWLNRMTPLRHSRQWNVLEELMWQHSKRLDLTHRTPTCPTEKG